MLPLADSRDGTLYLVLSPLRVVAFNTVDGWMHDVTADIARELRSWSERACENSPEPTPMATLRTAASSATTQAARRLKGSAPPHGRPGDEPSLARHEMSAA